MTASMHLHIARRGWAVVFIALAWLIALAAWPRPAQADPNMGPGGPILVVTQGTSNFGRYYAEILRNEGFNAFAVSDIASVTPTMLTAYDVVILAKMPLTGTQVTTLSNWVSNGGNLIAMAPDAQLAGLLGLTSAGSTLSDGYLLVDSSSGAGNGIVNQTMQFHGTADRYTLSGAASVAALYNDATTSTANPAVTLRTFGSGHAAAFVYDLATSVVQSRQGNPAWAAQERDGFTPIRSDDKFFGGSVPDWINLSKVAIPQVDEQQRLLANLILQMNLAKKPLPRFWYFPFGKKAVVIMTGDDHGNGGTAGRFDRFKQLSPAGCSVQNWECVRGTSYMYPTTPLTDAQAQQYTVDGFEVGLHVNTGCADFTPASLTTTYDQQMADWLAKYPSVGGLFTQRHHCIVWSDWATGAQVELSHGMRLDTSYYFWPPGWVNNTPGLFTGSAMPMRFMALDGTFIDVFMAASQMTDESGQTYPFTIDTLLDRAIGAQGYYGAYTINAHTDVVDSPEAEAVVASAQARGVPVVSSKQMLTWLDARNDSAFSAISRNGGSLTFSVTRAPNAIGLQAMLPMWSPSGVLSSLKRGSTAVPFTQAVIKGIQYAFFSADAGTYVATYAADTSAPGVSSTSPAPGATGVALNAPISATFSEAIDPATININTFELRGPNNSLVSASVGYDAASSTATLVPSTALAASTTYTAVLHGGSTDPRVKDLSGNALASNFTWSFTTAGGTTTPACPCSAWSSTTTPTNASVSDPNGVELGVRFRVDVAGYITGIRFYKGNSNTGTHIGSLWSASGTRLATATFTNESASGWQQVNFSTPVAVTANTVYVASYYAPNGNYAGDNFYFANSGVDNGVVHLLQDGVSGGNGVYAYGSTSSFPTSTWKSSNYWVDVAFTTSIASDTTPPTVTATSPPNAATGVNPLAAVTATFSEAINPATVSGSTFELRNASSQLVAAGITYDPATRTATLTPSAALAGSSGYTAKLKGGTTDPRIKDVAGNALASDLTWSFTTGALPACPCSAWSSSTTPANPSVSDPNGVELGVKFRVDVAGYITGVRFYKGNNNTGTHIGSLWSADGTRLATATFTNESASGWQQVNFGTPVAVAANTVYVASYYAPNGNYAGDNSYFANSGVNNGVVHLLQDGASGGNGVYAYGGASSFPSSTWQSSNYWVDVVFTTSVGLDTTPPTVTSASPANGATGVSPSTSVTAMFNEALDPASVSGSTFELRDASSQLIPASVSYASATSTATLTPSTALAAGKSYTAKLKGGTTDPRIKDVAGNALASDVAWSFATASSGPCVTPANPIVAENCMGGNPASQWDVSGAGDSTIQGFATDISVNRGGVIAFKVNTNATNYRFDIYRLGYYGGMGARKVTSVTPSATLPQSQPNCLNDTTTGLIDCGNWAVSGSWSVPANATSGIYLAKVIRADTGGASHIVFVVRDDASHSAMLYQTSDTTWQAYNQWGGNSLYTGSPAGRAYKVSYNRPFNTRSVDNGQDWVFNAEYPMVRWLERNGYDVSYFTGVDTDRFGSLILNHRVFLSSGHDEYWSGGQRAKVEAARNNGVHLAFFSGNEIFWKTRWENSIDTSPTSYRTLVCYKETQANAKIDPTSTWTGTWRDPRFSPPADGGRPENALSGTLFRVNDGATTAIQVPEADGKMRFWRNTSVATLASGTTATLHASTLGYEWDVDADNGMRPPGLIRLATRTVTGAPVLQDYGSTYASGTATHRLTLYKHSSGALVFGAGTVQWAWGLDINHDRGTSPDQEDPRMQQATVNLLADMGVQPGTLQSGLGTATASSDTAVPTSLITSPSNNATLSRNASVTIRGTAGDTGGGVVGGVEVSVDGGATWHPATGRASWTYAWTTPSTSGTVSIRSRAVDDSGNLQTQTAAVTVNVR